MTLFPTAVARYFDCTRYEDHLFFLSFDTLLEENETESDRLICGQLEFLINRKQELTLLF
jgi:hypothetical protein